MFENQTILVTGGTGSFGQAFIRTLVEHSRAKKIIVYSRGEMRQTEMETTAPFSDNRKRLRYFIGDVRDRERLSLAVSAGVDVIVHAAALKNIVTAEYNPFEAIKTNIVGTQNVVDVAIQHKVSKVIALSTDKACAPINLYGATKLAADKLIIAANNYSGRSVNFSVVRYGNVTASNGSVIPLFLKKRQDGPLPITDKRMTRFCITLQESADFVIDCYSRMWGGEIFIPKLPSYKLVDLARAMAVDGRYEEVGVRPGEKLHEELISHTELGKVVEYSKQYVILPNTEFLSWDREAYLARKDIEGGNLCPEGFTYNSEINSEFLSVSEIRDMIIRHVPGGEVLQ